MNYIKNNENGVISLEACIVLPMAMFLLMFVYGFMVLFSGQNAINHALIQSAQSLSLDPYSSEKFDFNKIQTGGDVVQLLYSDLLTNGDTYFSSKEKWYNDSADSSLMFDTIEKRFIAYMVGSENGQVKYSVDNILKKYGIQNGIDGIDFSGSKIEGNLLTLKVKYKQEFIFNFQGLASFEREKTVVVNLWGL